jgi:hypothetical protein
LVRVSGGAHIAASLFCPADPVAKLTRPPAVICRAHFPVPIFLVDEMVDEIFVSSAFVLLPFEKARKVRASRAIGRPNHATNRLKSATNRVFHLSFTVLPPEPI